MVVILHGTLSFSPASPCAVDLVREGFDPAMVAEPVFIRDDAAATYVPLTPPAAAAIGAGAYPPRGLF